MSTRVAGRGSCAQTCQRAAWRSARRSRRSGRRGGSRQDPSSSARRARLAPLVLHARRRRQPGDAERT
eukprot:5805449-Prymnesium_polylepis.1